MYVTGKITSQLGILLEFQAVPVLFGCHEVGPAPPFLASNS
jgi:hypothetical protein